MVACAGGRRLMRPCGGRDRWRCVIIDVNPRTCCRSWPHSRMCTFFIRADLATTPKAKARAVIPGLLWVPTADEHATLAADTAKVLRTAYETTIGRANALHVTDERWSTLNRVTAAVQLGYLLAADIARDAGARHEMYPDSAGARSAEPGCTPALPTRPPHPRPPANRALIPMPCLVARQAPRSSVRAPARSWSAVTGTPRVAQR